MKREVISKFKDKTFCETGIDLTTSEYGPSDDGEDAGGTKHATGFLFSLAYHSRSVIARSASSGRQTTCNPEEQHGNAERLATVETENIVMTQRVGVRGDDDKSGLTYLRPVVTDKRKRKTYTEVEPGAQKRLTESEGKSRSAQSLPEVELALRFGTRKCSKCRVNDVYLDIETLDWCEQCLWEYVNAD